MALCHRQFSQLHSSDLDMAHGISWPVADAFNQIKLQASWAVVSLSGKCGSLLSELSAVCFWLLTISVTSSLARSYKKY